MEWASDEVYPPNKYQKQQNLENKLQSCKMLIKDK